MMQFWHVFRDRGELKSAFGLQISFLPNLTLITCRTSHFRLREFVTQQKKTWRTTPWTEKLIIFHEPVKGVKVWNTVGPNQRRRRKKPTTDGIVGQDCNKRKKNSNRLAFNLKSKANLWRPLIDIMNRWRDVRRVLMKGCLKFDSITFDTLVQ